MKGGSEDQCRGSEVQIARGHSAALNVSEVTTRRDRQVQITVIPRGVVGPRGERRISALCFHVEVGLPAAAAKLPAALDQRRVAALAPGQEGIRILVVDDTAVNRAVLSRLLSEVGFDVREATTGDGALALWRSWRPHLIWMDKRMGGLDGLEVTRRIRAQEKASGEGREHLGVRFTYDDDTPAGGVPVGHETSTVRI